MILKEDNGHIIVNPIGRNIAKHDPCWRNL